MRLIERFWATLRDEKPVQSAASAMAKHGATLRKERERSKIRAKCNEMCADMGLPPAFKN